MFGFYKGKEIKSAYEAMWYILADRDNELDFSELSATIEMTNIRIAELKQFQEPSE